MADKHLWDDIVKDGSPAATDRIPKISGTGGDWESTALGDIWSAMAGNNFPISPAAGQRYFRTDLGLACYYDGTRWLSEQLFKFEFYQSGISWSPATLTLGRIHTSLSVYIEYVFLTTVVAATNDASNYWTVAPRVIGPTLLGGATTIYSITTASDGTSYTTHDGSPSSATPAYNGNMQVICTRTGSPENLTVSGCIDFRLIVT